MKSITQKLFYTVICTITLFGCGKNESDSSTAPSPPTSADQPQATQLKPTNASANTIKIKGLYIGMNIQDASSAMKYIVANQNINNLEVMDTRKVMDTRRVGEGSCILMMFKDLKDSIYQGLVNSMDVSQKKEYTEKQFNEILDRECSGGGTNASPAIAVWAGADGRVNRIYFNNLDEIFNAKGLPVQEFMKNFVNAYSIPEMKLNEANNGWTYVSPDGSKVEVRAIEIMGKPLLAWIHINKVAGANELKQGFN